jgi:Lon protease-like protein
VAVLAGNRLYETAADLPDRVPVFPLPAVLLLPNGHLPLTIFEPRYVQMVDDALSGDRLIGIIQPALDAGSSTHPPLCAVGCIGRITQFSETGDGRYLLGLAGVTRFRALDELPSGRLYRVFRISAAAFDDLAEPRKGEDGVDRDALLGALRHFLSRNGLEADWDRIGSASNASLVTALSMMSPWGPPEKQALLESPDHAERARTLIAITEIALAAESASPSLQ